MVSGLSILNLKNKINKRAVLWLLDRYGALFILLIVFAFCSFLSPAFLSLRNMENLLRQSSFIGLLALGLLFVVICGGIDLSIASIFALSCTLCALWQHWGIYLGYVDKLSFLFPPFIIFLLCTLVGTGIGLLNGLAVTKLRVPDFIVTLGTMITVRALAFSVTGGQTVFGVSEETKFIGAGTISGVPFPVLVWILVTTVGYLILQHTPLGVELFAIGQSKEAAIVSGILVDRVKLFAYAFSGTLAALSGVMMAGRLDSGEPRVGDGYELLAIAAVVIGGAPLSGGKGSVVGTLVGVLVLGSISNILNLLGIHPYPQMIFNAIVLLGAILLRAYLGSHE
ncbi:ABC transporter permease [Candidatus Caldatribacterium saccharofermentans]|uniref:ABC transporter permease n=1 Tax=Candidatus Caldatribacterium saccharofermentans TaxID=1454753 RepID=UPI003D05C06D